MISNTSKKNNFLTRILKIGIETWIKSQCTKIKIINTKIKTTVIDKIKFKIASIEVEAKNIIFKSIPIRYINLSTGPIDIRLNLLLSKKPINSIQRLNIKGELLLSEENLNDILFKSKWSWIPQWMQRNKLVSNPKFDIQLCKGKILIFPFKEKTNRTLKDTLILKIKSNKLFFLNPGNNEEALLPMDNTIKIINSSIDFGSVKIDFHSEAIL